MPRRNVAAAIPGHIADDASAQGDQSRATVEAVLHQRVVDQPQGRRVLVRLSFRDQHQRGFVARASEGLPDLLAHRGPATGGFDTMPTRPRDPLGLHHLAHAGKEPLAELDGIRALSQIDG